MHHTLEADRDLRFCLWARNTRFLFLARSGARRDRNGHHRCHRLAFSSATQMLNYELQRSPRCENRGLPSAEIFKAADSPPVSRQIVKSIEGAECALFFLLTNRKKRSIMLIALRKGLALCRKTHAQSAASAHFITARLGAN